MSQTCAVCGKGVRKTQLVYVTEEGGLRQKRVCGRCVTAKGFTVIAAESVSRCKKCGSPATYCTTCVPVQSSGDTRGLLKVLQGLLKAVNTNPPPPRLGMSQYLEGRIEALEGVIDLLKSGRW